MKPMNAYIKKLENAIETLFLRNTATFLFAIIFIGRQEERDQNTLNAILDSIIAKYSHMTDCMILINTKLQISNINLEGTICLIPSINILKNLFNILNLKYDLNL